MNSVIVSICMITYNHEKYIAKAIDSVIMQKTKFDYEIVIGEDCSTDKTREIVLEYKAKYPDKIKLLLQEKNVGMMQNFIDTLKACSGKYIALLEGDDYWIDPYKLQKQVDFLEANEEYGLVHSDCDFYYQEKKIWLYKANKNLVNHLKEYTRQELFNYIIDADYKIRTATVLFRKSLLSHSERDYVVFEMGDTPLWLIFSQLTKFKYFNEVSAVYRIIPNSVSRSRNKIIRLKFQLSMAEMRIHYSKRFGYPIKKSLMKRYNEALLLFKLYDPEYKEKYPLFEPTKYENFKLNKMKLVIFRYYFIIEWRMVNYINRLFEWIRKKY
uniref:Glycosyltransferase n=1 Tax=Ignavibacterium album TaxID=591197 RepID=A0A832DJV2_9BACT